MTFVKTTYNRRSFLKSSALAGGGMVLGFSWLASCKPTPEQIKSMPKEWFDINAFLKIADNGLVTIMSPNPEIGQNVKTAMPMIVAEELDVAWKDVIVEQAPLDSNKYQRQIAGGSGSIRESWQALRMAGATARRILLEAAAKEWKVPVEELTTADGVISHKGKTMGYGEIASAAAKIPVPEKVKLKDNKDFKIIGSSQKNVDVEEIITGKPLFGIDTKREGMLTAMIVHPPAFGMALKSMNADPIKKMDGIVDVFPVSADLGEGKQWSDVNAFTNLVAIVGKSTWQVMKAKKAIEVEWETTSKLESSAEHEATLVDLLSKKTAKADRIDGNPTEAFQKAAKVIERTYTAPFLAHNTMEPMNFFAHVTADKAELEGPIQTPIFARGSVAKLLGMEPEQVSVMMTRMGGGFGRRLYGNFVLEAAAISKQVNAPVNLIYTREDDMTQGTYRPDYKVTYRAAIDADNNLTGFHVRGAGTNGSPVFANRFPAGAVDNYLAENHSKDSNISTGAWRAPKSNFIACAEQCFLDEVAGEIGKDPIDFRLELFERAEKNPVIPKDEKAENDYDAKRYAGVLKLVKEKSNWANPPAGVYRGVSAYFCHRSYVAQVVDVVLKDNQPVVQKVHCAVDCGIVVNPMSAKNQIEGGIVDGIGHAMYSGLTFKDGRPEQSNFDSYRLIRHSEAPLAIETHFVDNGIDPTGLGEPSLPPIAAAVANAIAAAKGERLYTQPFVSNKAVLG